MKFSKPNKIIDTKTYFLPGWHKWKYFILIGHSYDHHVHLKSITRSVSWVCQRTIRGWWWCTFRCWWSIPVVGRPEWDRTDTVLCTIFLGCRLDWLACRRRAPAGPRRWLSTGNIEVIQSDQQSPSAPTISSFVQFCQNHATYRAMCKCCIAYSLHCGLEESARVWDRTDCKFESW